MRYIYYKIGKKKEWERNCLCIIHNHVYPIAIGLFGGRKIREPRIAFDPEYVKKRRYRETCLAHVRSIMDPDGGKKREKKRTRRDRVLFRAQLEFRRFFLRLIDTGCLGIRLGKRQLESYLS